MKITTKIRFIFFLVTLLLGVGLQNAGAQHSIETSVKVSEVQAVFANEENLYWAIPTGSNERVSLFWKIKRTSFSDKGIYSYVAYDNNKLKATLTISEDNVVGSYFSENEIRISGIKNGFLKIDILNADCPDCEKGCKVEKDVSRNLKAIKNSSLTNRRQSGLSDNLLRKFRLAILISPFVYEKVYNSNVAAVRAGWASIETQLNEIYEKEVGIQFTVVDDERLILKDYTREIDTRGLGSEMSNIQSALDGILSSENYDIGFGIVKTLSGAGGVAHLRGVYANRTKGRAAIGSASLIIMAHELGHLFGAKHTFETGGIFTNYTEPGRGYSTMSYGSPRTFFSITSLKTMRSGVMGMPYYTSDTAPDTGSLNSIFAVENNNHPPVIKKTYHDRYVIPPKTFFGFTVDAYDPDGDKLLYGVHQSDSKKAIVKFSKPTANNQINFTKDENEHYFTQYYFDQRTSYFTTLDLNFYLMAFDAISTQENHSTALSTQKVLVNIKKDAKPFKITNTLQASYNAGDKIDLKWDVDNTVFDANSKVRILLSDDLGKTFPYVLEAETENDGSHTITLPDIAIQNDTFRVINSQTQYFEDKSFPAGVIKIEVIDHIAYAVSTKYPFNQPTINTFTLQTSNPMNDEKQLQIYTGDDKTLANIHLSESVTWYDASENGSMLPSTTSLTDNQTYYAQINEQSPRFAVTVKKVSENEQTVCNATFSKLMMTPSAGAVLHWFDSENNGSELSQNTALTEGTYYVEEYLENIGYTSNRVPVDIKLTDKPNLPEVTETTIEYTVGDTATPLQATASNGNSLIWYVDNQPTTTAPTPKTNTAGTFVFWVSQTTSGGCESDKQKITVNITEAIQKADITGISFKDKTFVYDGNLKSLNITGNLPNGTSVSYQNNDKINAGAYEVIANISGGENYNDKTLTATLTISKAEVSGISFEDKTFVYDGNPKSLSITGNLPNGTSVSYQNNDKINAGAYEVIANISGGENYNDKTLTATLTISKAEVSGISFEDKTFVYDGNSKSLSITGNLPNGTSVNYQNNDKTNAGAYEVTANISGGENYHDKTLTATLTISKAEVSGISFEDKTFVYDGNSKSLSITGNLPNGTSVNYQNNDKTNAGAYEVIANISGGENYHDKTLTATLTISKAEVSGISFEDKTFVYDGNPKSLSITGNLPNRTSVSYQNNDKINAGAYEVIANISGGENYHSKTLTATLTIKQRNLVVTAKPQNKIYGENDPIFSYAVNPKPLNGDTFTGALDRESGESIGNYSITQGNLSAGDNYQITFVEAIFEILKPTVIAKDDEVEVFVNQIVKINVAENDFIDKRAVNGNNYSIDRQPNYGAIVEKTDGIFEYKGRIDFTGEDSFTYTLCDNSNVNCQTATVRILVKMANMGSDFSVEEFITPNGDNYNDNWGIAGLVESVAMKVENKVMLFDKLGRTVFEKVNYMYDNELFDGHSNVGKIEKLPAGYYFYVIEVKGKKRKSGILYIVY